MKLDNKLKITFSSFSIILLITLLIKLRDVPGGMILSGLFLGLMLIVFIIIACLITAYALSLILRKYSFLTHFSILISLCFILFHYSLYSPHLTIKVPNGYKGEVNLVLSNVKENILTVDSNGIGYLNKWTFDKVYTEPVVEQLDGKNLRKNLVVFNSSGFWAYGKSCCIDGKQIQSKSFEIVPDNKLEQKQYNSKILSDLVDKRLIVLSELDEHTIIHTK